MAIVTNSSDTSYQGQNPFEFTVPPRGVEPPKYQERQAEERASAPQPAFTGSQEMPYPQSSMYTPQAEQDNSAGATYSENTFDPQNSASTPQTMPGEESALFPGMTKPIREEVLLEWQAPVRPYKAQNRQVFTTIGVIGLLIGLILFFAGQLLPVAVVFATVFLVYVMYSTPPSFSVNKLTTFGIRVENNLYYWEEMGRFWFTEKYNSPILHIEIGRFPDRLTILLGDIAKEDMQMILSEVLVEEVPPPTAYEKAAKWLHEKIPINLES